jgi:hypothetical protein
MGHGAFETYVETGTKEESNWRSVILFGRNVASYKFALAKSLIELAQQNRDSCTLEELAIPYTRNLCEHLAHSPKQATSPSSKFLQACADYNSQNINLDELVTNAVKLGFNNVLDAFHVVNQTDLPVRFFEKNFTRQARRITLTDATFKVAQSKAAQNILQETESRWNLVETAWEMGVSANLLSYDQETQQIVVDDKLRRKSVTSARGALNGYQKGQCFYCYSDISVDNKQANDQAKHNAEEPTDQDEQPKLILSTEPPRIDYGVVSFGSAADDSLPVAPAQTEPAVPDSERCDVDHFFPHILMKWIPHVNFDGVWNLVLACIDCNRGEGGKFARIPELVYLDRLYRRNEYLILSHHPLRETLIAQTGDTPQVRWQFLKKIDTQAVELLPGARWSTEQRAAATF